VSWESRGSISSVEHFRQVWRRVADVSEPSKVAKFIQIEPARRLMNRRVIANINQMVATATAPHEEGLLEDLQDVPVLLEALAAGRSMHAYCLRFFEHRLHVLPVAGAFLCVLSELWSPSSVLKMAMNVTGRRFK